jgi:hypothetical protein
LHFFEKIFENLRNGDHRECGKISKIRNKNHPKIRKI